MATKMAGRLTVQERAQIAARYEEWNSVVAVQRWWLTVKERNATIRQETIKNSFEASDYRFGYGRTQKWPSTSRSQENVALMRDMFTHSPRKSTSQAASRKWTGKGGAVPGKTSHNGTNGGPDSQRYYQRPTRRPTEHFGFHPRWFEEAGGCRRCLH